LNERLTWLFLAGSLAVAGVMFLAHGIVGRLLLGVEYRGASYLLPWMILAGGVAAAGQVASVGVLSSAETKRLIAPKIATSCLGIALVALGAWRWGLPGVVGGLLGFACSYCAWSMLLLRQLRGTPSSAQHRFSRTP
jgi:O-antigen/teichoic acid export membrane protein